MTGFGMEEGETCGRDGCEGEIRLTYEPEGGCSCHISPPCGYCVTPREECNECDWRAVDDTVMAITTYYIGPMWGIERKPRVLDRSKIDYVIEPHSNSSQKCVGVFPPGTPREDVIKRVEGTFGGRFERFNPETGDFVYIAYTD